MRLSSCPALSLEPQPSSPLHMIEKTLVEEDAVELVTRLTIDFTCKGMTSNNGHHEAHMKHAINKGRLEEQKNE